MAYACGDFSHGQAPVRSGLLTVATYDVPGASLVSRTTVFGEPGVVDLIAVNGYYALLAMVMNGARTRLP